jgi:potassium efflux system protein
VKQNISPERCARAWSLPASVLALLIAFFALAPCSAAEQQSDQPEAGSAITTPAIEALQAQIERIDAKVDLNRQERERITSIYRDAMESRRRAEEYRRKTEQVESLREEAPDKEAELAAVLGGRPPTTLAPTDATQQPLETILARIAELEGELESQRTVEAKLDGEINHRAERRKTLPREASDAKMSAESLRTELAALPAGSDELTLAKRERLQARIAEMERKAELSTAELASYDGRRGLLSTRRDVAALRARRIDGELEVWRNALSAKRKQAAAEASRQATDALAAAGRAHPALAATAAELVKLAEERGANDGVSNELAVAEKQLADIQDRLPALHERFDDIRQRAAIVGYTNAIGALLRKERQNLPTFSTRASLRRQAEIADVQYRLIELEDERSELADVHAEVESLLAEVPDQERSAQHGALEKAARDLVVKKREYLDALIDDYEAYFLALIELDNAERELQNETQAYRSFINEHILWIRDAKPLGPTAIPAAVEAALWIVHYRNWQAIALGLWSAAGENPIPLLFGVLAVTALFYYQPRLRRFIREAGVRARNARTASVRDSVAALLATFAVAFTWPALMSLIAFALSASHGSTETNFEASLSHALASVAMLWLTFEFLRQLCRKDGIAETQLGWSRTRVEAIRRHTPWALASASGAMLLALTLENHGEDDWQASLGRMAFLGALAVMAIYANRIFASPARAGGEASAAARARPGFDPVHVGAVGFPVILALQAAAGWYFSALQIARHVPATTWLIVTILVADRMILRWLRLAEFRLRREQAKAALQEARKREERKSGDALVEQTDTSEELPDIAAVSAQTRQLLRLALGTLTAVGLYTIWDDVLPAFRLLDRVQLWTVGDDIVITLSNLVIALLVFAGAALAARNVPGLLEIALFQRLPLDSGVRYAARAISRYVIVIAGTLIGFGAVGIGWSDVQWLVAAMTVGLGFGLQEIFANFVSGIILLFERPIRVGDTVTLGTTTGTVTRIQTRATTITDFDRKELIVPNKEFITGQLINWSLSDNILRLVIPVGIAYGSDVELAEATLLEAAKDCQYVLTEPEPSVLFDSFGDNALQLQLRVFIATFDHWLRTRHAVHKAIDAKFRSAGIEISFPQRDLHLRSVDAPIPVRVSSD